jgi:AraC-like DNA-binding protein
MLEVVPAHETSRPGAGVKDHARRRCVIGFGISVAWQQHPLAHRRRVKTWSGALQSPPCAGCAGRADPMALAGEGDEVVMTTVATAGAGKTVRKDAAFQIFAKRLANTGARCEFPSLDSSASEASLRGLDSLIGAALGQRVKHVFELTATVAAERRRCALDYMHRHVEAPDLSPPIISRHLGISPRQLHRTFEASGQSVAGEIRRLRCCGPASWCAPAPGTVTEIAMAVGVDSLAAFYRVFKARFGMTASEWRASAKVDGG